MATDTAFGNWLNATSGFRNDQPEQYQGHEFRDSVLHEFHQTLDVPRTIDNIDVVWKFGIGRVIMSEPVERANSTRSNASNAAGRY